MTQHYVGTKQIVAWPQEKDGKAGYAVKYPDGYVSWSPKDVFEAAYLPMGHVDSLPAHQQRAVGEYVQLRDKVNKITGFIGVSTFNGLPADEQDLLVSQLAAMEVYAEILSERVRAYWDATTVTDSQ